MEIKYLIWDFDGVLCDSKTEAFKVHNYLCKKFKSLPKINNENDYAKLINNKYDKALSRYLSNEEIQEYFKLHRDKMYEIRNQLKTFNEVIRFIKNVKIDSIILMSTYCKLVKDVLENNGYKSNIFRKIIGREDSGSKSDKMKKLLKYLDVKNEEVLYIGDTMNDVEFCKELNIPIIAVSYGYCAKDSFMETDVISISDTQNELINNINIYCNEKD